MHSEDYEKRILKPTTCLTQVEVLHFVQSFGHLGYQRQVDFNQVTCSIDDLEKHVEEIKPHAGLGDLLDIKSKTRKGSFSCLSAKHAAGIQDTFRALLLTSRKG